MSLNCSFEPTSVYLRVSLNLLNHLNIHLVLIHLRTRRLFTGTTLRLAQIIYNIHDVHSSASHPRKNTTSHPAVLAVSVRMPRCIFRTPTLFLSFFALNVRLPHVTCDLCLFLAPCDVSLAAPNWCLSHSCSIYSRNIRNSELYVARAPCRDSVSLQYPTSDRRIICEIRAL